MNPVLMLTRNNLALTMRAAASVMRDAESMLYVVDNGSTDGTRECIYTGRAVMLGTFEYNAGVSKGWNLGLNALFGDLKVPYVLVINNDVVLPLWFYKQLLSYDKPFVSGVSVDKMEQIAEPAPMGELHPHPDFSGFLIKREVWEKVGPFDETMKHYASDNDFHVRAHKAGVPLWKANVPFFHERSSTLNLAPPEERAEIEGQANRDRAVFQQKWGCQPWGAGYDALFG
jgi:GT2 family glycosyltransferase